MIFLISVKVLAHHNSSYFVACEDASGSSRCLYKNGQQVINYLNFDDVSKMNNLF